MIQRTKCELISRVHRRKATILPTSRKWMISQGKRDGWILSRMRLLADDIVSFSIPLPFFTHLLISLSRRFEIRGTKMREKERERERFAREVRRPLIDSEPPSFPSIVPPSRVSTVARHLLALCPWRKEKSLGRERERGRGRSRHSILRFLEKSKGSFSSCFIFEMFLSPLTILPSSSDRFVNPSRTCFEFYHPSTSDGRDPSRMLKRS